MFIRRREDCGKTIILVVIVIRIIYSRLYTVRDHREHIRAQESRIQKCDGPTSGRCLAVRSKSRIFMVSFDLSQQDGQ